MNSEQQRIAIAEWMGWKWELHKKESNWWLTNPSCKLVYGDCEDIYPVNQIPNYPNDLNAIHEAEEHPDLDANLYDANLSDIVLRDGGVGARFYKCSGHPFHASASQRSEALCRTLCPERFEIMKGKE